MRQYDFRRYCPANQTARKTKVIPCSHLSTCTNHSTKPLRSGQKPHGRHQGTDKNEYQQNAAGNAPTSAIAQRQHQPSGVSATAGMPTTSTSSGTRKLETRRIDLTIHGDIAELDQRCLLEVVEKHHAIQRVVDEPEFHAQETAIRVLGCKFYPGRYGFIVTAFVVKLVQGVCRPAQQQLPVYWRARQPAISP